jgi:aldehyde:ferredoxin oxidoreductase
VYGYAEKILYVDLVTGSVKTEPLREEFAKLYLGGTGFGLKMLVDSQKPGIDPLSPENPLIFTIGPLAGTMAPAAGSKHGVFAKSPESSLLGESYSQGFWGAELRRAGYGVLLIRGRSESPVYLWIDDESVELKSAAHLWGRTNWEAEDAIREELGDVCVRVASIGPAGEGLSRIASIINDRYRAAGRTGLGAVMGSKRLKAVAVRGSHDVQIAEPEKFKEFCKVLYDRARGPATAKYRTLGTPENVLVLNKLAALPTRNWQSATFEGAEKISGEYLNERLVAKIEACSGCPMRCEHVALVSEGEYKGTPCRVEYQPTYAFGSCCGVDRLDAIVKSVEQCDLYGLDAISTGVTIAFAMECFERGILSANETEGLELKFGNAEAMIEMIKRMATRSNLGDVLADGVKRASERIGKGSEEFAMHIKGVEMTGYDIRGLKTAALGYAVSRRGACHLRHGAYDPDVKGRVDRFKAERGRGKMVVDLEDLYCVIDSLILCKFSRGIWNGPYEDMARIYSLVTGMPVEASELRRAGERISNLGRLYNLREGLRRSDDTVPPRVMSLPIPDGVAEGSRVTRKELDLLLDDYYEARGWTRDGVPKPEKLRELGLEQYLPVAESLGRG